MSKTYKSIRVTYSPTLAETISVREGSDYEHLFDGAIDGDRAAQAKIMGAAKGSLERFQSLTFFVGSQSRLTLRP